MMDGFFGMGFGWIVFRFKSKNYGHYYTGNKIPMKILKERYANGKISNKEFERMKKDLM